MHPYISQDGVAKARMGQVRRAATVSGLRR